MGPESFYFRPYLPLDREVKLKVLGYFKNDSLKLSHVSSQKMKWVHFKDVAIEEVRGKSFITVIRWGNYESAHVTGETFATFRFLYPS